MCSFDWKLALEYARVLIAWPVLGSFLAVFVVMRFREPLVALINRIKEAEGFGVKVSTAQAISNAEAPPIPLPEPATLTTPPQAAPPYRGPPPVPPTGAPAAAPFETGSFQRIDPLLKLAEQWEFSYLNYFFAFSTQMTIELLLNPKQPIVPIGSFNTYIEEELDSALERSAVVQALETHKIINRDSEGVSLSERGVRYATWKNRSIAVTRNTEHQSELLRFVIKHRAR